MSDRCPHCGGRKSFWGPVAIIKAINEWATLHGQPPKSVEWRRGTVAYPADAQVRRVFGSWNAAIAAAGLVPRGAHRPAAVDWTREQMRHAFFLWVYRHGRQPQGREWGLQDDPERPTLDRCIREFGSWNAFVVACGYEPLKSHRDRDGYRRQAGAALRDRDAQGRMVA